MITHPFHQGTFQKDEEGRYIGTVPLNTRNAIDAVIRDGSVPSLTNSLTGITLHDFQTYIPAIAYLSKRFLIGADTGLGKSLMIAAYLKIHESKGTLNGQNKAIIATTTSSLSQIQGVIEQTTGLRVKHIPGDETKLMRELAKKDLFDYDIYIVTHSAFSKSVQFNKFMVHIKHMINIFVLDESMAVASKDSITHMSIRAWIKDCEYRLFANATVIERSLEQLYYQFELLESNLLEPIETLKKRHEVYAIKRGTKGKRGQRVLTGFTGIGDMLDKMPYHYVNISRFEMGLVFESEDVLVPLVATPLQKSILDTANYYYALFSPTTQMDTSDIPFDIHNVPALSETVRIVKEEFEARGKGIVIYAEPTACKAVLLENIYKSIPGINVGIIDGLTDDKDAVRIAFNNNELHCVIINIPEALDLVEGEVMVFYTIPSKHYQARARIARGLETEGERKYYYLVYLNTPQTKYLRDKQVLIEKNLDNELRRGVKTIRNLVQKINHMELQAQYR